MAAMIPGMINNTQPTSTMTDTNKGNERRQIVFEAIKVSFNFWRVAAVKKHMVRLIPRTRPLPKQAYNPNPTEPITVLTTVCKSTIPMAKSHFELRASQEQDKISRLERMS